jgi:hypothetical protein
VREQKEREREREKERDRCLEGKTSIFYRDVIQITSRLGQRDFGDFPTTDVLRIQLVFYCLFWGNTEYHLMKD